MSVWSARNAPEAVFRPASDAAPRRVERQVAGGGVSAAAAAAGLLALFASQQAEAGTACANPAHATDAASLSSAFSCAGSTGGNFGIVTDQAIDITGVPLIASTSTSTITVTGAPITSTTAAGTADFTQNGTSTTVLGTTGLTTYSGDTLVSAGTLQAGAVDALSPNSNFTVNSILDLANNDQTIGSLAGFGAVTLGAGTLTVGRTGVNTTFDGSISGSGGVTLDASAGYTLPLTDAQRNVNFAVTGTNTYTGTTTDNVGFFILRDGGSVAGAIVVNASPDGSSGGTLNVASSGSSASSTTVSNTISGRGGLLVSNTQATFSGDDSNYTGRIQVDGSANTPGAFVVGSDTALANGRTVVALDAAGALDLNGHNAAIATLTDGTATDQGVGTVYLNGGRLTVGAPDASVDTFNGVIADGPTSDSPSGSLEKVGSNTLQLFGANTYSGGTVLTGGTVQINTLVPEGTSASLGSGTVTFNGGTLQVAGGTTRLILSNAIQVTAAGGTIDANGANALTLNGTISDGATVGTLTYTETAAKTDASLFDFALSGTNTTTGGAVITSNANVQILTDNALGRGALDVEGILGLAANTQAVTALTGGGLINADGYRAGTNVPAQLIVQSGTFTGRMFDGQSYLDDAAYSGVLSLTKVSDGTPSGGTLTLTGASSYSGGTRLQAGTIAIGASDTLGTGTLAMSNGTTLQLATNGARLDNVITLAGNDTVDTQAYTGGFGLHGAISGTGTLVKIGSASLGLYADNTYSGGTMLDAGQIVLHASGGLGTGTLTFAGTGTALVAGADALTVANAAVLANAATIDTRTYGLTYGGTISGGGQLSKVGTGTLTLSGHNTYAGGTLLTAGTVVVNNAAVSGGVTTSSSLGTGALTFGGGALKVASGAGLLTFANAITVDAVGGTLDSNGSGLRLLGAITGPGGLTFAATGGTFTGNDLDATSFILAHTNSYAGGTTVQFGAQVQVVAQNALGSGSLAVDAGGLVDLGGFGQSVTSLTGSGLIAGTGARSGTPGSTTIEALAVQSGNFSGRIVSGESFLPSGTTLDAGDVDLVKVSDGSAAGGTLVLSGNNSYGARGGRTLLDAGTIAVGSNMALGASVLAMASGTTLGFVTNGLTLANQVALNGTGDPTIDTGSFTETLSGTISGTSPLTKQGTGTLILTGDNTFTGGTTIAAGTLQADSDTALGTGTLTYAAGASLKETVGVELGNAAVLNGRSTFETSDTVAEGDGLIYDGVISGTGTLVKTGATGLRLTAANTYAGGTDLVAGHIGIANNASLGTGTLTFDGGFLRAHAGGFTLANAAVLAQDGRIDTRAFDLTYAGAISGPGQLTKSGIGTLTLSGANSYAGGTTIVAGTVAATTASALGTGTLTFGTSTTGNTGTLQAAAAGLSLGNDVALASDGTIDTQGYGLTLTGTIAGAGQLTKTGSGTLTPTGSNSYGGGTVIDAGTVVVSSIFLDPATKAIIDGGEAKPSTQASVPDAVTLVNNGGTILSSVGYGPVTLNGGALRFDLPYVGEEFPNRIAIGPNGGTVDSHGTDEVDLDGGLFDSAAGTGTLVFANTGTGGPGHIDFSLFRTSTFSGGSVISNNTDVVLNSDGALGTGALQVQAGGVFDLGAFNQSVTRLTGAGSIVASGDTGPGIIGTLTVQSGAFSGTLGDGTVTDPFRDVVLHGALGLTKVSDGSAPGGTLALSGTSTYSGRTTVSGGTLLAGSSTAFSPNSAFRVFSGATLDLGGFGNGIGSLAGAGTVTNSGTAAATLTTGTDDTSTTFSGVLADGAAALALAKVGTGMQTLAAASTYSGGTTLAGGTLAVGNSAALGTGGVAFAGGSLQAGADGLSIGNAATLAGNGTVDTQGFGLTYAGAIGGPGQLVKLGPGTLALTGTNTYAGGTILNAGTLAVGSGAALGSGALTFAGGALQAAVDGLTLNVAATLAGSGTIDTQGFGMTYAGAIGGPGQLVKLGSGTLALAGANTYAGGTALEAGTLAVGNGAALGGGIVTFGGGVLQAAAGGLSIANAATLGATGIVDTQAFALTYGGAIGGGGQLVKLGTGTLTLPGANSYTGGTTLTAGTVAIGDSAALGTGPLSFAGGVLQAAADGLVVANAATLAGTGTFDTQGFTLAYTGAIGGAGQLVKTGVGILSLPNANSFAGGTALNAGTIAAGNAGALGTGVLTFGGGTLQAAADGLSIGNAATLASTGTIDTQGFGFTYAGAVAGLGQLVKIGSGTLSLASANTFAGGTVVRSGTLAVADSAALGTGGLTLDDGTTLQFIASGLTLGNAIALPGTDPTIDTGGGFETISGAITGPGALTKIGAGTLALTGTSTYTGDTTVAAGTLQVDGSIASSSVIVDSGAVLGGGGTIGALTLQNGGTLNPGGAKALTVVGNATFASGSTYQVTINGDGTSDKLNVGGAAALGGSTLSVLAGSGTFGAATYTLLSAAGGVSGTFGTVNNATSLVLLTPTVSYGANSVSLTLTPVSFPSVAATPNEAASAAAAEALGPASPVAVAVVGEQSVAAVQQAFAATSGVTHADPVNIVASTTRLTTSLVVDRLWDVGGNGLSARDVLDQFAPDRLPALVRCYGPMPDPVPAAPQRAYTAWGEGFGSFGHNDATANAGALDRSLGGFVLGIDTPFQNVLGTSWRIGIAGGYTDTTYRSAIDGGAGTVQGAFGSLYGGARYGAVDVRVGATVGGTFTDARRTVAFPGFLEAERSSNQGITAQGFGEVGYRFTNASTVLEPIAGAAYLHVHQDGFSETGGAAALNVKALDTDLGTTSLGFRGEVAPFKDVPLTAHGLLAWQHTIGDITPATVLAFEANPSQTFSVTGAPIDRDALAAEAALDYRASAALDVGLSYTGLVGPTASDHSVKGRFEYRF